MDGALYILTGHRLNFKNILYSFSEIDVVSASSADPDEMPHMAAFHLDLHCVPHITLEEILSPQRVKSEIVHAW